MGPTFFLFVAFFLLVAFLLFVAFLWGRFGLHVVKIILFAVFDARHSNYAVGGAADLPLVFP
jgi:hypothetical protein